jgi:hypothetical protein
MRLKAGQPIGLPVNARVVGMDIKLMYDMPPRWNETYRERIYIGRCRMNAPQLDLSSTAGDEASLDVSVLVDNPSGFAIMVDHLLTYGAPTRSGESVGKLMDRDYSVPIVLAVDVVLGAVQVILWDTPVLSISDLTVHKNVLVKGLCRNY